MPGNPERKQLDQRDWARLFLEHVDGKSVSEIASEQALTREYVVRQLRDWKGLAGAGIEGRLKAVCMEQFSIIAAAMTAGDLDRAAQAQRLVSGTIKSARDMGLNMKDVKDEGDKRDMADLPDPRIELLERYDRIAAARDKKGLAEESERRAGEAAPR